MNYRRIKRLARIKKAQSVFDLLVSLKERIDTDNINMAELSAELQNIITQLQSQTSNILGEGGAGGI